MQKLLCVLASPELSILRVNTRRLQGGHDGPEEKLETVTSPRCREPWSPVHSSHKSLRQEAASRLTAPSRAVAGSFGLSASEGQ
jgi:hypothetical protein